jgi:hypothetical protein
LRAIPCTTIKTLTVQPETDFTSAQWDQPEDLS